MFSELEHIEDKALVSFKTNHDRGVEINFAEAHIINLKYVGQPDLNEKNVTK